jgi:hypothetical protein
MNSEDLKVIEKLAVAEPDTFIDILKLAIYKTSNKMVDESWLTENEKRIVDWLVDNQESKLKDFFLADLSWANTEQERQEAFINFFTKRTGKRVIGTLPEDIKNYVLANSVK